jgi:hypothetical protein
MEDELWSLGQQSRVVREFRQEIQGVWDDAASRQVNTRYLNPHEEAASHLVDSLRAQQEALLNTRASLRAAGDQELAAGELAAKAADNLKSAGQQEPTAYSEYENYVSHNGRACQEFPLVVRLLEQANEACE